MLLRFPFVEYYTMNEDFNNWKSAYSSLEKVELTVLPERKLLYRNLKLPNFDITAPKEVIHQGTIARKKPKEYIKNRSFTKIGELIKEIGRASCRERVGQYV